MRRRLPIVLGWLWLGGCATLPGPGASPLLEPPLPPASFGRAVAIDQIVDGIYPGGRRSLRFRVEITPSRIVMLGLSHLGVPLFALQSDASGIAVTRYAGVQAELDPALMLADFQIAWWPAGALAPGLAAKGLVLHDDAGGRRAITDQGGRRLVEVTYASGERLAGVAELVHYDHPYRLQIRTLTVEELP